MRQFLATGSLSVSCRVGQKSRARAGALTGTTVLAALVLTFSGPVHAQSVGGVGGADANGNPGGAGGTLDNPQGDNGTGNSGGGGGGPGGGSGGPGGGGGGDGGDGGEHGFEGTSLPTGDFIGEDGGNGGSFTADGGGGGGGGAGGFGALLTGPDEFTVQDGQAITGGGGGLGFTGSIRGGTGGDGGTGVSLDTGTLTNTGTITGGEGGSSIIICPDGPGIDCSNLSAGGGGRGGIGVSLGTGDLINDGTITGGGGGPAGTKRGGDSTGNPGGDGGIGVSLDTGTLTNAGTITGGDGDSGADGGANGLGGAGIAAGSDVTIINGGAISGGFADDGDGAQANAIEFGGGTNRLELHQGSTINGNVLATTGTDDTFALGGDADGTFDLSVIGDAAQYQGFEHFDKSGPSTWTVTNSFASWNGDTTVSGGVLQVDGTLSGPVEVLSGGTLGGTGTVGTTTVGSGGTISPGNSIGTLNVAGNITFAAGSTYEVEVDPVGTASDLIQASGSATLDGGSVVHIGLDGSYDPSATYTILTAEGGVTGTFDEVSSNFAFLDPTLLYDPNTVFLELVRNATEFADVGETRNQIATADGVESLGLGDEVFDALVQLDAATARRAFDLLSGQVHASLAAALVDESHYLRDAVLGRLRQSYGGAGPLLALGATGPSRVASAPQGKMALGYGAAPSEAAPPLMALPTGPVVTSWAQGLGAWGELDGNGNAASLDRSLGGVITGLDATLDSRWRLGLAGGYSRSEFDIDDRASSATNDNYHLALYGGGQLGPWAVRGGGALTWHDIETRRNVAFPGFAERLEAETDARTGQVFGEIGYGMGLGRAALEPFAGLAYVDYDGDRFTETGGAAALSGGGQSFETTFSTLGVRAATIVPLTATTAVTLHGMLGWRHAFGDVTPAARLAFSSGGEAFSIAGVPLAEDSLVTEAGLDVALTHSVKLGVNYEGQFADQARDHAVTGRLRWRF